MDITNFTEFKTGTLEPFETESGRNNYAFVPHPLGDEFDPSDLWKLVADARDSVARLEQIKGILSEPFLLLRPLQQREALRSSRLEGTITLPEELLLFDVEQEQDKAVAVPKSQRRNDSLEVWNHYEALREGHKWTTEGRPLDKSLILYLHKILMSGVRGKDKSPGRFRDQFVAVGSRPRRFIPPPPIKIDACIDQLCEYMNTATCEPLCKCFLVHYQFEAIHPFEDGNGRVGRVLLSLCMSTWLQLTLPWLYLSDYYERNRREYTERMFRISTNGEWNEWIEFCLHATIEQSRSTLTRCERLKQLHDKYIEEYSSLGNRMRQIIELLFVRPVLRVPDVAKQCNVSIETARLDLKKLVKAEVLHKLESGKPRAFACLDIINVAYGDEPVVYASPT